MVTGMADGTIVNRASVATAFFNYQVGSGQYAVAKNFLAQGREVRPIRGLARRSFWYDAGNHLVSLPKFHSLAARSQAFSRLVSLSWRMFTLGMVTLCHNM